MSQRIPTEYIGVIFIPRMNSYTAFIEDPGSDIKFSAGFYNSAYEAAKIREYQLIQLPAHVRARIPSNFIPRPDDAEAIAVLANPALMPDSVPRVRINMNLFGKPANQRGSIANAVATAAATTAATANPWAPYGSPNYIEWIKELNTDYAPTQMGVHAANATYPSNTNVFNNSNNDRNMPSYAKRHPKPPFGSGRKSRKSRKSRRHSRKY
jgi:hypothetical protein